VDWGTIDVYTCIQSCDFSYLPDAIAATLAASSSSVVTINNQTSRYRIEHVELQQLPDVFEPTSTTTTADVTATTTTTTTSTTASAPMTSEKEAL
jgi:hypothetical protein